MEKYGSTIRFRSTFPSSKAREGNNITIEQLLIHRSGYAPDFDLRERWTGYDEAIKRLIKEPLRNPPGTRFTYSDIGFIALGEVVKRVSGMPLDQFAKQNIFVPLHMRDTGFRPAATLRARIAPTEKRRGQLSYLGDTPTDIGAEGEVWLRGQVHDPTSYRMDGVAGHAGLFSTAKDLCDLLPDDFERRCNWRRPCSFGFIRGGNDAPAAHLKYR